MEASDFDEADRVAQKAFGRSLSFRPMRLLHQAIEPHGLWVATLGQRLVGAVSCVDYDPLAYIGLMAVDPDFQRRGIARQLIREALAWLDGRRTKVALLDATDAGAPLYEQLGFVDDSQAYVFERTDTAPVPGCPSTVRAADEQDLADIIEFDAPIFGANRGKLFEALWREHGQRAIVTRDSRGAINGYLLARDPVLGPWAASDVGVADQLLTSALTLSYSQPPMVLVPRSNELGRNLLLGRGFRETRRLRHMRRGGDCPPGRASGLYGQSSFGHG